MPLITDDVVISGVGGYFPKSRNIAEFQTHLLNNANLITSKWSEANKDVNTAIGKIESGYFDNNYFKISNQQTGILEIGHLLIFEPTYEALLDAGVNPSELSGKNVGCFIGGCNSERNFMDAIQSSNNYYITGHARNMIPNRISYWLNIHGPSFYVNCCYMDGLEALRQGKEAIENGHCDSAIVGSFNLTQTFQIQKIYNDMGLISPNGSQKSFDNKANGYVRGDAIVILYLQRSSEAKRSYASVVNVDCGFLGNTTHSFLNKNVNNFTKFLKEFYQNSTIQPHEVDYVEAYGCGIKKLDEIEIDGLEKVYCKNRENPLLIGAVKPNTGHSEGSSALVSLVKVLIAMETETIPATINYNNPNPNISALKNGNVEVVTTNRQWNGKYAAINCFGLSSYYGHILLKSNSKTKIQINDTISRLVLAASRTEKGIEEMLHTIESNHSDKEYISLIQEFFSKPTPMLTYRGFLLNSSEANIIESQIYRGNKPKIWFVYSGMGSQWNEMVGDLMNISVFAESINRSHNILVSKGVNLIEIITSKDPQIFDNILHSFIGIAAIQIALTDVLKCLNIVPDGIIGHSVGELGCAYADGCVTSEEAILAAYYRGRASLEANLVKGMMAAVGIGYNKIKHMIPPTIEVACHNSADSCTISGPAEDMEVFVKQLQNDGIFARLVNVANIAYHSQYIKPAAPILLKYLKQVLKTPVQRSSKWISTSNPEDKWDTDLAKYSSAEYHTNNLLSSVLFEEGFRHIPKDAVLIEIAPHGLLQAILKRACAPGCSNIPLTQRGIAKNVDFLLTAIGRLYLLGLDINITKLYPKLTYPVGKGTTTLANLAHWNHSYWSAETSNQSTFQFIGNLNNPEFISCKNNKHNNKYVMPISIFLNVILKSLLDLKIDTEKVVFEDLTFFEPTILTASNSIPIQVVLFKGSGGFEILANDIIVVSGKYWFPYENNKFLFDNKNLKTDCDIATLNQQDIYEEFKYRNSEYTDTFKSILNITLNKEHSTSVVNWNNNWTVLLEAMIQQQLLHDGEQTQESYLPYRINKIAIDLKALPSEPTKLTIQHNYLTKAITTLGVNIIGMQTIPFSNDNIGVSMNILDFIPLKGHNFKNFDSVIYFVLKTLINKFSKKSFKEIEISEFKTKKHIFNNLNHLKVLFANYQINHFKISNLNDFKTKNKGLKILVSNTELNENLANVLNSNNVFVLVATSKILKKYESFVEVFQFTIDNNSYSLLQVANNTTPVLVHIKESNISIEDLEVDQNSVWVKDLKVALDTARQQGNRPFLQLNSVPREGIPSFAEKLFALPMMGSVRLIVSLNSNRVNNFLPEIFEKDLRLNVIENNVCGTILPMPLSLKTYDSNYDVESGNINIAYIGINNDESLFSRYKEDDVINVDYSGTNDKHENVMGIAQFHKNTSKLTLDPILQWKMRNHIFMEEAAAIPMAYACAYYCLVIKGKLQIADRILIHSAHTPIGLAAIAIACAYYCKIYLTVETEDQKQYIKDRFKQYFYIYKSTDHNFQPLISEATGGEKMNIILNTLSESLLETSFDCIGGGGRIIHIGNNYSNLAIGMNNFIRHNVLSVFNPNNLHKFPNHVKTQIKSLIDNGIENYKLRLLDYQVSSNINVYKPYENYTGLVKSQILQLHQNKLTNKNFLVGEQQFVCNKNMSYLIIGGTVENWCEMIEWFISKGAKHLALAIDSSYNSMFINRYLNLLRVNNNANITIFDIKSKDALQEVFLTTIKSAPIDIVCVLPKYIENICFIQGISKDFSPKSKLLLLSTSVVSLPGAMNVVLKKNLRIKNLYSCLDKVVTYNLGYCEIENTLNEENEVLNAIIANNLLPKLSNMIEEYLEAPEEPNIVQLTSSGVKEIREMQPFFVIPGLSTQNEVKSLALQLTFPIWMAILPKTQRSINEMAKILIRKMKAIYSGNVYNLIGVSWGGVLMTEIAKLLEAQGANLNLFFIDSAPNLIKPVVNGLLNESDNYILNKLLILDDKDYVVDETLSMEEIMTNYIQKNYKSVNVTILKNAIINLKSLLKLVKEYHVSEKLKEARTHLIRPNYCNDFDTCELEMYFQRLPKVKLVEGDHLSIISNKDAVHYISENHEV